MEMALLVGEAGAALVLTFLVHQGHTLGQARAAVARHLPEIRQAAALLGPGVAVAVLGQAAGQPAQAVLLDHHQTGPTAEEDVVRGHLFDLRPRHRVEDGQQRGGALGGRVRPASQLGDAGRLLAEYGLEQAAGDGQADAFGLGGGREAGQAVTAEDDGLLELTPQVIAFGIKAVAFVLEGVAAVLGRAARDGLEDAGRVAVQGLPGSPGQSGLSGNRPVGSLKDGRGIGNAELRS